VHAYPLPPYSCPYPCPYCTLTPFLPRYSSKGVLYVAGQRFERGAEVRVTQEAGATLEGVIASVTSGDVRIHLTAGKDSGRETRVQLQSLVTRKATIVKRSAAA
jgi:hypothetical protein